MAYHVNIQKSKLNVYLLRTKLSIMEKQYCKVGSVKPIAANADIITLLEYQYQNFLDKASNRQSNNQLEEFFEKKAQKIKRILENLV